MRTVIAILVSAVCFFARLDCNAQDPCARTVTPKGEKSLTSAELAHHLIALVLPEKRRFLAFGDVEFVLRCGTQKDAAELFADIRGASIEMGGATIVEADRHVLRFLWDDGHVPRLGSFKFNFDAPLDTVPHPGERLTIRGTYSSYGQNPLQINMTDPSIVIIQPAILRGQR